MYPHRFAVLAALIFLSSTRVLGAQPIDRQNTVAYSNIAPGELENDLFFKNFPVKIILLSETGKIYPGAYVRVFNASGIAVFKMMCEKPWLFLKLPEGYYHVVAVDRNQVTRLKPFRVAKQPAEGVRRTVIRLTWPKSVVGY
jgi:hypothetical protein